MAAAAPVEEDDFYLMGATLARGRSGTFWGDDSEDEDGGDAAATAVPAAADGGGDPGRASHIAMVRAENERLAARARADRRQRRRWRAVRRRHAEAPVPGEYGLAIRFAALEVSLDEVRRRLDALETAARRGGQGGGRRRKSKRRRTKRHKRKKRNTRRRRRKQRHR